MTTIINTNGTAIDFEAAVNLMDDAIREEIHGEGYDTEQEFFEAYVNAHFEAFGEEFEADKANPVF